MHTTIEIQGKAVEISTSKEADAVLTSRQLPLTVEMELLFSSLLFKKVKFLADKDNSNLSVAVNDKLSIRFRPLLMEDCDGEQPAHCNLSELSIDRASTYVPKWLHIDFRFGHWFGEFGYFG